jgi:hypothetical protein
MGRINYAPRALDGRGRSVLHAVVATTKVNDLSKTLTAGAWILGLAILLLALNAWRYESLAVGDGTIIQRDRLTNDMRKCTAYAGGFHCSGWE